MRLQMEMVGGGVIPEEKYIFNQQWRDLWNTPVKDKKLGF